MHHGKIFLESVGWSAMDDGDDQTGGAIAPDTPGTRMSVPSDIDPQEFLNSDDGSSPAEITYVQSASSSSNVLTEFSLKHVWLTVHLFHTHPLEQGYLKDNFGDSTPEVLPLIDLFDPSRFTVSQQSESADGNPLIQRVSYKKRVYEQCVNFSSFKTKRFSESYQREVLIQKWLGIVHHTLRGSKTGALLTGKDRSEQLAIFL